MVKKQVYYRFTCDDCGYLLVFPSLASARSQNWAISRNRENCYCPKCAVGHRNVGRAGSSVVSQESLFGYVLR